MAGDQKNGRSGHELALEIQFEQALSSYAQVATAPAALPKLPKTSSKDLEALHVPPRRERLMEARPVERRFVL